MMPFSNSDLIVGNATVLTNEEYEKQLDVISDSEDDEYVEKEDDMSIETDDENVYSSETDSYGIEDN